MTTNTHTHQLQPNQLNIRIEMTTTQKRKDKHINSNLIRNIIDLGNRLKVNEKRNDRFRSIVFCGGQSIIFVLDRLIH